MIDKETKDLRDRILLKLGCKVPDEESSHWLNPNGSPILFKDLPDITLDWMFKLEEHLHGTTVDIFEKHLKECIQNTYTGCRTSEFASFIEDQIWHANPIQRAKAWLLTVEENPSILHFIKNDVKLFS